MPCSVILSSDAPAIALHMLNSFIESFGFVVVVAVRTVIARGCIAEGLLFEHG